MTCKSTLGRTASVARKGRARSNRRDGAASTVLALVVTLLATLAGCSANEHGVSPSGSGASQASGAGAGSSSGNSVAMASGQSAGQSGAGSGSVGASGQGSGSTSQTSGASASGAATGSSGGSSGAPASGQSAGQSGGGSSGSASGQGSGSTGQTSGAATGNSSGGSGMTGSGQATGQPDGGTGSAGTSSGQGGSGSSGTSPGSPLALCNTQIGCVAGQSCVESVSRPGTQIGINYEGHCLSFEDGAGNCAPYPSLSCNAGYGCYGVCVPTVAVGDECGINGACPAGSQCIPGGSTSICTLDGELGAPCRATSPLCNAGLGCTSNQSSELVCEPLIAQNQECGFTGGCPDPGYCVSSPAGNTCASAGQLYGFCGAGGTCNAGLDCQGNHCQQLDPAGGSCLTGFCTPNYYCDENTTSCLASGAQATPCLADGTCDAGLTCASGNACEPTSTIVADGATCNGTGTAFCQLGSSCSTPSYTCVADGAPAGACRTSAPVCDAGLVCTSFSCVMPIAVGQTCTVDEGSPCVAGSSCVSATPGVAGSNGSCIVQGTVGGACRSPPPIGSSSGPPNQCDDGLACWANICKPATIAPGMACNGAPTATAVCAGTECINSVCVAAGKLGGICRPHDPSGACDTLLGCQSTQGRCVLGQGDGAACSAVSPCGLPDICVTSKCALAGYGQQTFASTFVDACTNGVHVQLQGTRAAGHSTTVVSIPFSFSFWKATYAGVWPSTRGVLYFGGTAPPLDDGLGNGYLPTDTYGPAAAPFWDDIYLRDAPGSDICLTETGAAPNREFVVEWAHAGRVGRASDDLTFEVVLHETSNVVELVYGPMNADATDAPFADGSRAAIGIQSGNNGVAVAYEGTVAAGVGIRYTPQ
jgi:hypothetical protein